MRYIYWRLSGFYWFYFGLVGYFIPFWGLYLQHRGFSVLAISQLMAMSAATKLIAPNLWGYLADRFSLRIQIIRLGALGAFMSLLCGLLPLSFIGMFFMMMGLSFFWNAILPQFEVITLGHLAEKTQTYSRIRLWGSLGFIASVLGGGIFFHYHSIQYLPYFMLICLLGIFLSSCWVNEPSKIAHDLQHDIGDFWQQLKHPASILFFIACFLMQLGHGPYYTLFSIYVERLGYDRIQIGGLWAIGVLSEISLFLLIPRWFQRHSLSSMMLVSTSAAVLRWALLAWFADYFIGLLLAQLLHAATFGLFHLVCLHWVHRHFSRQHQGQGQALYNSIGYGAGGALGALFAGLLWKFISPASVFVMASFASLLACVVIWFGLRYSAIKQPV